MRFKSAKPENLNERLKHHLFGRVGLVATGPDFSTAALRDCDSLVFVNHALGFFDSSVTANHTWFVSMPILDFARSIGSPSIEAKKSQIRGRKVKAVVASSFRTRASIEESLDALEVRFSELIVLHRGVTRQLLLQSSPSYWLVRSLITREFLRNFFLPSPISHLARFAFAEAGNKESVPYYWRPSAGVEASLLLAKLEEVSEIVMTGISLTKNSYFLDGREVSFRPTRGHDSIDRLLLRSLVLQTDKTWSATDSRTCHLVGFTAHRDETESL